MRVNDFEIVYRLAKARRVGLRGRGPEGAVRVLPGQDHLVRLVVAAEAQDLGGVVRGGHDEGALLSVLAEAALVQIDHGRAGSFLQPLGDVQVPDRREGRFSRISWVLEEEDSVGRGDLLGDVRGCSQEFGAELQLLPFVPSELNVRAPPRLRASP
jgi:hypothetical protein